jgi:hypothetical protein
MAWLLHRLFSLVQDHREALSNGKKTTFHIELSRSFFLIGEPKQKNVVSIDSSFISLTRYWEETQEDLVCQTNYKIVPTPQRSQSARGARATESF